MNKKALAEYKKARKHILLAIDCLHSVNILSPNNGDARYYIKQLSELVSCDDDEAGLTTLIRILSEQ